MISLLQGGITHHYVNPKLNYCNTVNNVGTIKNNYTALLIGNKKFKFGSLVGKDSACANIYGPIATVSLYDNIDFILGFYNTNTKAFNDRGMIPVSSGGITPLAGWDFKIPLYTTEGLNISLDNIVSIGIVSHAISFNF